MSYQIFDSLDKLDPNLREIVEMRHGLIDYQIRTYKEIAEAMGYPLGRARNDYGKAMLRLKRLNRGLNEAKTIQSSV
jgi:DNA-directed RNA polymerase sigma subunit (sigma70/sigma32)